MPSLSKQPCESRLITCKRGGAAIVAMIVISAMVILIATSYGLIALGNLEIGFASQKSGGLILSADSCAEEALIRLSRDNTYSGGSLTLGDVACTITVTGTPCGTCSIDAEASVAGFTRNIQAGVSVSGTTIDITSWEEID